MQLVEVNYGLIFWMAVSFLIVLFILVSVARRPGSEPQAVAGPTG